MHSTIGTDVSSRPRSILVVDDDQSTLTEIAAMLEEAGFRVLTATHAMWAARLLSLAEIDVVVADADLVGVEMLQAVRRRGTTVPVVLMSGHRIESANDAIDVVSKPVHALLFLTAVERAVAAAH